MAGYKSVSFDPDEAAAASDLASAASDAASKAIGYASGASNAASAASVKAAAASSKIAAQSSAWEAGGGIELGRRNAIINGGMDVWQRGTVTLTSPANNTYFLDRFVVVHSMGDGTFNLLQSAETPAVGFPFNYSLQLDCTAAESAVAAGERAAFRYKIEGFDFKRFEGETATLSFWVKAVKTGIYCVAFYNAAGNKAYVVEYTINSASTWEKKTATLTFNSGGTFLYTTGIGLYIEWIIMVGSNFHTTAEAWQSGNYLATSNQVNGLDSTDNNFWLTGVQLELGSVATPFEVRPFAQELDLASRYAQASSVKSVNGVIWVPFRTQMRAAPTVTPSAGSSGDITADGFTLTHNTAAALTYLATSEL
uniref:Uncharacterized protein n=1 Tax=viral metagenome TaxID=1070528 RepID=A0A6M3KMU0_9ZZZZ